MSHDATASCTKPGCFDDECDWSHSWQCAAGAPGPEPALAPLLFQLVFMAESFGAALEKRLGRGSHLHSAQNTPLSWWGHLLLVRGWSLWVMGSSILWAFSAGRWLEGSGMADSRVVRSTALPSSAWTSNWQGLSKPPLRYLQPATPTSSQHFSSEFVSSPIGFFFFKSHLNLFHSNIKPRAEIENTAFSLHPSPFLSTSYQINPISHQNRWTRTFTESRLVDILT